jgi:UDP-N-acetylglucosamine transferase subunit ALG13
VVTVGTDHHQFDRLIGWVNGWLGGHQVLAAEFFVQYGSAQVRPACDGSDFLDAAELDRLLGGADVIICHGGPGSIADAWERGRVPIVVPRLRRLGEVVDDHQVDFCRKLAGLSRIRLAEDETTFAGLIDEAAAAPDRFVAGGAGPDVDAAVTRFGELVDELVSRPVRRRGARHRQRLAASGTQATSSGPARQPGSEGSQTSTAARAQAAAVPQEERT